MAYVWGGGGGERSNCRPTTEGRQTNILCCLALFYLIYFTYLLDGDGDVLEAIVLVLVGVKRSLSMDLVVVVVCYLLSPHSKSSFL